MVTGITVLYQDMDQACPCPFISCIFFRIFHILSYSFMLFVKNMSKLWPRVRGLDNQLGWWSQRHGLHRVRTAWLCPPHQHGQKSQWPDIAELHSPHPTHTEVKMSQSHLNGYNHSGSLWTYCICPICTKLHQLSFLPSFSHVFVSRAVSCQVSTSPARFRMARTSQRKSAKSVKVSSECQIQRRWSSRCIWCIMSQHVSTTVADVVTSATLWPVLGHRDLIQWGVLVCAPHMLLTGRTTCMKCTPGSWVFLCIFTLPILALSFAMVRSKSKHSSLDSAKLSILERSCRADLDNTAVSFHAMLKTTSLSLLILQYVLGRFCSDSSFKIFQVPISPISALDFPSISIRICQPFLCSQPPWDWRLSSFIPLSCPKILQSCRFCSRQTFQESA